MSSLHQAIVNNDHTDFRAKLSQETLELQDSNGHTPLLTAIIYGREGMAVLLIRAGANLCAATEKGSALHLAISKHQFQLAGMMLAKGADPNRFSPQGHTALDLILYFHPTPYPCLKMILDHLNNQYAEYTVTMNIILQPEAYLELGAEITRKFRFHDKEFNPRRAKNHLVEVFVRKNYAILDQDQLGLEGATDTSDLEDRIARSEKLVPEGRGFLPLATLLMSDRVKNLPPEVKENIASHCKLPFDGDRKQVAIRHIVHLTTVYALYQDHRAQLLGRVQDIVSDYNSETGENLKLGFNAH